MSAAADSWATVLPPARRKPLFPSGEANDLEKRLNIRFLSRSLQSAAADTLLRDGWEYNGIRRGNDTSMLIFDINYEYFYLAIDKNPWNDSVVFRRSRPTFRENRSRGAPKGQPA